MYSGREVNPKVKGRLTPDECIAEARRLWPEARGHELTGHLKRLLVEHGWAGRPEPPDTSDKR